MAARSFVHVPILGAGGPPPAPAVNGALERPPPLPGPRTARALLEAVGAVAGPATVVSALALYFGIAYTNAQAFYFGIDGSALGYSSRDYVVRSADALFVPIGAMALAAVVLLRCHAVLGGWLARPGRAGALAAATWALGAVGALLFGTGVTAVFRPLPFRAPFLLPPLGLALGTISLGYAAWLRGRRHPNGSPPWMGAANVVLASTLVLVGLFWATSDYARALGRGRAQLLEARLALRPEVVVYSTERLHLSGPGVDETELEDDGSAYRFRYGGLRLFTFVGGTFVLLPVTWASDDSRAILLTDDGGIRVEFSVGTP